MSKIVQSLEQKQRLTPKQILEANILQLNIFNLEQRIIDELENNPALEIDEENKNLEEEESIEDEADFDWEELSSNPDEYYLRSNKKNDFIEQSTNFNQKDLTHDIIGQLEDSDVSEKKMLIAHEILGNLDERGYLNIEPVLISDKLKIEEDEVLSLIEDIKTLDPPGIASRNIQECILAQLKIYYPDEKLAFSIIENYFDDFANKRFKRLMNKMHCKEDDIYRINELISVLNPIPAINYSSLEVEHIVPDIVIEKSDGDWRILINNLPYSSLKINSSYITMLDKYNKNKEVKNFVKQKINSANWFIEAIEQRNKTYKKVVHSIIKKQKKYFDSDEKELIPMILKDIANDIDMDISTISRVANGKYIQMPWGIKEIKYFFSEGIKTKDGHLVSNSVIKNIIKEIIFKENKGDPYNDDIIVKKLDELGYILARRTVAKYREILNIPVARLRKKYINKGKK